MNDTPLAGRTALVTGGGRGAGAAIALALADAGAAVVVTARTMPEVDAVAGHLTSRGARAWAFYCDVADPSSIDALARAVAEHSLRIDVLVNNAGVSMAAPVHKTTLDDWEHVMRVNATGTFLCTRTWLPPMVAQGWGRIVNVASTAGVSADRYISAYAASKHAVVGLTRAVASEVADRGVTVNAVCPSYLDTDMTRETLSRIATATGRDRAAALQALLSRSPQQRLVTAEEVAATVVFLCSEQARGITGTSIVLDGGELRR